MQNEDGKVVDIYIPRKCSATNRMLKPTDHASVQINVAKVDENGKMIKDEFITVAVAGFMRQQSKSDACLNRLFHEKGLLSFSK